MQRERLVMTVIKLNPALLVKDQKEKAKEKKSVSAPKDAATDSDPKPSKQLTKRQEVPRMLHSLCERCPSLLLHPDCNTDYRDLARHHWRADVIC